MQNISNTKTVPEKVVSYVYETTCKRCIVCFKETHIKCNQCKIVFYCDNTCLQNDYKRHSLICNKTQKGSILKNIIQWHQDYKCDMHNCTNGNIDLSNASHYYKNNKGIELRTGFDRDPCILCKEDIDYQGNSHALRIKIPYISKHTISISYYRCITCKAQNNILCTTEWISSKECLQIFKRKMIITWLGMKTIIKKVDIIKEIIFLCKKIHCCS